MTYALFIHNVPKIVAFITVRANVGSRAYVLTLVTIPGICGSTFLNVFLNVVVYLQCERFKDGVLRDAVRVDGIDLDEVLRSGVETADVEDRLVRRDVDHHRARVGLVHLKSNVYFTTKFGHFIQNNFVLICNKHSSLIVTIGMSI